MCKLDDMPVEYILDVFPDMPKSAFLPARRVRGIETIGDLRALCDEMINGRKVRGIGPTRLGEIIQALAILDEHDKKGEVTA